MQFAFADDQCSVAMGWEDDSFVVGGVDDHFDAAEFVVDLGLTVTVPASASGARSRRMT